MGKTQAFSAATAVSVPEAKGEVGKYPLISVSDSCSYKMHDKCRHLLRVRHSFLGLSFSFSLNQAYWIIKKISMDHCTRFWKKVSPEDLIAICCVAFFCLVLDRHRAYLEDLWCDAAILADGISDLGRTCWGPKSSPLLNWKINTGATLLGISEWFILTNYPCCSLYFLLFPWLRFHLVFLHIEKHD